MTRAAPALALTALALAACGSQGAAVSPASTGPVAETRQFTPTYDDHGSPLGLHEFNPFSPRVTSGAQPEGEEGFRNLVALGFRTIVSVDGALPDVATAKKYGLRYVHVPTRYSGVTHDEAAKVAKAIEISDGPVYVHCHHGKHRSPAALGAACVNLGLLTPEQAVEEMKASGTDAKYQGLFRDVMQAKPLTREELAAVSPDLPESVRPDDLATAMVSVDFHWDNVKAAKAAKWAAPEKNPDLDPPHEARMLWEQYREIARLPDTAGHGESFAKFLAEAEASAKALEDALRAGDAKAADEAYGRGGKSCSGCHAKYRDN